MHKPGLPSRPQRTADAISARWLCGLLDAIKWLLDNALTVDNKTIRRHADGTIYAVERQKSGGGKSPAGASIFFARPWAKNETYSSEGFNVYNADVFATCQANSSPDSNQMMYIPYWVTPYEIDFTASSPVIMACIKADITLPVPDDAPAGTEPTTLTVYVPIDNGWVIR